MPSAFGATGSDPAGLGLPRGEVLGRYESYLDAQKVVDYLADNDFPVANVSIVGNDLKMVERVTGKLSYPRVALAGAAQGAMFGMFVGLLLSLFTPAGGIVQILSSVGLGMAIWMVVGVLSYSFRRGKRDFASSNQVLAGYYDVVVAFEHAAAARRLAEKLPMSRGSVPRSAPAWAPAQQPAPPAPAAPGAEPAPGAPQPAPAPRSGYADLPDGRPQFGVRIDPAAGPVDAGRSDAGGSAEDGNGPDAGPAADNAPAGSGHEPGSRSRGDG
ncbi:general stress protein [Zafaria sp. Z1313]|uniref:general stress protein n=1 Tax=Zafaria sp. Z1313 TaxID=3423202 RepID=UPI003D303221